MTRPVPALLIDLDGTLYTDAGALPGAIAAIGALRRRGVPFRFVTNTTRRSRQRLLDRLRSYGFVAEADELFTSVLAGVTALKELGVARVAPFVARETLEDFADFELVGGMAGGDSAGPPDAVVLGDLGAEWTPHLLNQAFRYLLDGARLIALQKDRYWLGSTGLELDAGPYVAALEYATGRLARVCGKPSPTFYGGALASLGLARPTPAADRRVDGSSDARNLDLRTGRPSNPPAMVGDDLWADIEGAQQAGLQGWLVRTGKFREDVFRNSGVTPDRVLDSVAELGE